MFLVETCVALVHHIYLSDRDYPRPRRDKILLLNIAAAILGERQGSRSRHHYNPIPSARDACEASGGG